MQHSSIHPTIKNIAVGGFHDLREFGVILDFFHYALPLNYSPASEYHSRMDDVNVEQSVQAKRIERILIGIFQPKEFRVTFMYFNDEISFRIDDASGRIIGESYRGTPVSEIKSMSDGEIENRLRELLANTHRLLHSMP